MNLDPDPAIVIDLQDANKKLIFSAYYFLRVHLHHFSKIKSKKESQNTRNCGASPQGFSGGRQPKQQVFLLFLHDGGRIRIHACNGSGSWRRPKNMWIWWIRIRILNTVVQNIRPKMGVEICAEEPTELKRCLFYCQTVQRI
jgi:hypothetical protein